MEQVSAKKRLKDKYFLASVAASIVMAMMLRTPASYLLLMVPVAVALLRIVLPVLRARMKSAYIDQDLLFLIAHMYAVSTGKPMRKRLFDLKCIAGDYGEYESILKRIAVLAVEWSYGFVTAIRMIANKIRNLTFRDFLLRFSEVLRTGEELERFLDVEYRALRRNFQTQYYRAMDVMRIVLGLYTTLMSSAAFVVTVMTVLMLFTGADISIYVMTIIGTSILVVMFTVIVYVVVPKERLTPKLKPKPSKLYRKYNISTIIAVLLAVMLGYYTYNSVGRLEFALAAASLPLLLPGFVARRIEKNIKRIESFYPIFIRSFGLTFAIIPHQTKTMQSILMSDFGPLNDALRRVYARLTNGVDPHVAWRYFINDTWSDLITRSTNIIIDTIDAGGNTQETGVMLSDTFTRILDLRNLRERTARTFEATIYLLQMLVTAIATTMLFLLQLFIKYIQAVSTTTGTTSVASLFPFFSASPNLSFITNITIIFLAFLTVVNALAIKVSYGGMMETFWIQFSTLLMLTSGTVAAMRLMVTSLFGQVFAIPLPPT